VISFDQVDVFCGLLLLLLQMLAAARQAEFEKWKGHLVGLESALQAAQNEATNYRCESSGAPVCNSCCCFMGRMQPKRATCHCLQLLS
jgi:hypothetical protein